MRCMEAIIVENGLDAELGELWENNRDPRPGRDICLDYDSELDELSDAEDPEQQLRAELADRSAMVQAVQGALECRQIRERDGHDCDPDPVLPSRKG